MKTLLSLILAFLPIFSLAQQPISGHVVAEDNTPLPFANVILTDVNDKLLGGTITTDDGSFVIDFPAEVSEIKAFVSFVGYESDTIFVAKDDNRELHFTMRENTNGFALRALVLFYKHCILKRVNLVFDMTLLEPEIDLYLMTLAKKMGYRIQTHVLCVPRKVSDTLIAQRQKQTGRFVKPSSSGYFFTALAPSLKALIKSQIFDRDDTLILWSHTLTHPIQITHFNNKSVLRKLNLFQQKNNTRMKNPKNLLMIKKKWMRLICKGVIKNV